MTAVAEHGSQLWVLLAELPPGHPARRAPLRTVGAQCRNKLGKEWRDVARWALGVVGYDELGAVWTECNEFRVPTAAVHGSAS